MNRTKIEYLTHTWNPISMRCDPVSEGCENCWHLRMCKRMAENPLLKKEERAVYAGKRPFLLRPAELEAPMHVKKPAMIGVQFMGDLFHENVSSGFVMQILRIMVMTPHTFLLLTKRQSRMRDFFMRWADTTGEDPSEFRGARGPEAVRRQHPSPRGQLFADMLDSMGNPPAGCAYPTFDWAEGMLRWPAVMDNIWLGVTVENQARADERIPILLSIPAAKYFVSVEPMLSEIDLRDYLYFTERERKTKMQKLSWVICGPETGSKARECKPAWIENLHQQCFMADIPFYDKRKTGWLERKQPR